MRRKNKRKLKCGPVLVPNDLLGSYIYESSLWGEEYPDANGEMQSPVNILSSEAVYQASLKHPLIDYGVAKELDIINSGCSVVLRPRTKREPFKISIKMEISDSLPHEILGEYNLLEIVFHWGKESTRGSEHTINCKPYPMEIQIIHINTKYSSSNEAYSHSDGVVVITILGMTGQENTALKPVIDTLQHILYKGESSTLGTCFQVDALLPDASLRGDFWTYQGSLTSPPCTECVTWIVHRYPIMMGVQQLEEFRRLHNHPYGTAPLYNDDDGFLVDNFRQTQALKNRKIYSSFHNLF